MPDLVLRQDECPCGFPCRRQICCAGKTILSVYHILLVHICAITLSGSLFFARGLATLFGAAWPRVRAIRSLSYMVDTTLLASALTLVFILPKEVFANQWLSLKLFLVVGYIALGVVTMRQSLPKLPRWLAFGFAELLFLNIVGIAFTHSPFGWLSLIFEF
ncbi:MAG: hypothetical protein B7Z26_00225 [Asticcacaulis sp. 32-58-5]|nr:MAG: hypothetical protein B7Z26_00225 [Asticcacaulis sp. 32-58-5]